MKIGDITAGGRGGFEFPLKRWMDKTAALKQLKSHVAMFGVWVAAVRVTPYLLHYFSDHNEELTLEL
ncbi:hypothetical protein BUALT_Bualt19G0114100 [Buddleja alternifolia]|uniref:Mitochondrial import receptor subunit TOM6 homolog n=1 Tax=Buddleja alternifolia TaxID=168488 RepID=A0AAV6W3F8_9LAMI|nr:hypothetical protein BUALT_Bualt19G0114100 [Buddleja alternifolia]